MTLVAFLRHGPTAWNAGKRLQGMTDIPLSPQGRADVARWTVPPDMAGWRWLSSPLSRALETACLLHGAAAEAAAPLREMSFGAWEGTTVADLRLALGDAMRDNEARGLDLAPPGGESPRDVMNRLSPWLADIAADGRNVVAVTHKGVIRVVLAMATGWDMKGRQPLKLDWHAMHVFRARPDGSVAVERLNVGLTAAPAPAPGAVR